MTKKQKQAQIRARRREQGFYSLDINTGVEKLRPEDLLQREAPSTVRDAHVKARLWRRDNWFVEQVCRKKLEFFNYGLDIKPANPKAKAKLKKLMDDPLARAELYRFIDSVWSEWVLQDTVVGFWRDSDASLGYPFLLLPELCRYSDAFGIERMWFTPQFKKEELQDGKNGGLDPNLVTRYSKRNEIELLEEQGEYFHVVTRGLKGQGFAWPRLRTVFRTLSQNESMEVGEFMYALAGRLVVREHKIGFEVRSAANAMRQENYLFKKARALDIQKFFNGRHGLVETVQQFDHLMQLIWTDPKLYDARKWDTVINRLMWWAGPVGFMMLAKGLNPYLLQMFEVEAEDERRKVGAFCEHVIGEGFDLPVKLGWSNRCFRDSRLAWEMVKFFTQQGPLSLTTGLEEGGFDPEEELERKSEEKGKREQLIPLWDPSHGKRPGDPDSAGRPPKNPDAKKAE